jgi:hypothetical protein
MNAYNYAVKFQRLLWHPDEASIILTFTTSKKHLTMLGLTALSKWTGCYDKFKSMRENLGLKWSVDSGSEAFRRLLNESKQIEDIGQWLDQTRKLGDEYSFPIAYMALTGLARVRQKGAPPRPPTIRHRPNRRGMPPAPRKNAPSSDAYPVIRECPWTVIHVCD